MAIEEELSVTRRNRLVSSSLVSTPRIFSLYRRLNYMVPCKYLIILVYKYQPYSFRIKFTPEVTNICKQNGLYKIFDYAAINKAKYI